MPEGFEGGKTFMETVMEGNELVIPANGCAFVLADVPEEPAAETASQEQPDDIAQQQDNTPGNGEGSQQTVSE